jgi:hypothetical protein
MRRSPPQLCAPPPTPHPHPLFPPHQVMSQIVKEANCGTAPTMRMDDNITAFEDCLGGCERILKTPVPLSYTRHTSRFLMIWLTLLPFSLYSTCGLSTIPLCVIIAFLLLGEPRARRGLWGGEGRGGAGRAPTRARRGDIAARARSSGEAR